MMANAYKLLGQGLLASGATGIYQVTGSTETIAKHMRFVNSDTSNCTLRVYHNGTGSGNYILPWITVEAGGWVEMDGVFCLDPTGTLYAEPGSSGAITYTVYGVEVT